MPSQVDRRHHKSQVHQLADYLGVPHDIRRRSPATEVVKYLARVGSVPWSAFRETGALRYWPERKTRDAVDVGELPLGIAVQFK